MTNQNTPNDKTAVPQDQPKQGAHQDQQQKQGIQQPAKPAQDDSKPNEAAKPAV